MICSCTGCPLAVGSSSKYLTIGCDGVVKPGCAGARWTEVGCAASLGGEPQPGRRGCRPSALAPGFSTGVTSRLFCRSPSKRQPTCAPVSRVMHASGHTYTSVRACLHIHAPIHLCMCTSGHSGIRPCVSALIHLHTPVPTHWVSI